jgi:two-component system cell cycle response regulator
MAARILIVEDNPANLELMSYLLRAFGHTVIEAHDGEAGLERLRRDAPDLILCDIQLPGIGGIQVGARIRKDPAFDGVPLVAVSALAMVGDRETILAAGFDGYLAKPIVPETFAKQVDAFLPPKLRGERSLPASETSAALAPPPQGPTILVVDDRQDNLDLAASLFTLSGYRVVTAGGIQAALAQARHVRPDLILSDVVMTDGNGYDLIRQVKADPLLAPTPFLFITSTMTTETERAKGLALGAARYLFRPVEPHVLLSEVEACLRRESRD